MATPTDTFAPLMRGVAMALLGTPNKHLSNDETLRWGNHGSFKVDLPDGVWHDKEANIGGGVLDLVMRERGCDKAGALAWLEGEGLIEPREKIAGDPVFYEYADESGEVLFKVERKVRNGKKTFLQHGPDGNGGFVCRKGCMQGVRRVLYRLPELIAADPSAIVFVCEGEKDADNIASREIVSTGGNFRLIATTNPGGAGKFLPEFAPMLKGRRVVILQDNDQAGRDHAADVKAKLEGIAAELAILSLPGGDKSDVSDWMASGGTRIDLLHLAEKALADASPDLLPSLDLAALANIRAKPVSFAIERLAPMGEVTLFTGPGSAGKSLLAQQLCTVSAAAIGTLGNVGSCLGLAVKAGPAIYTTCEDTGEHLHFRQERLCETLGIPMASLAGKLHLVSLRGELGNELECCDAKGNYSPTAAYHRLAATIKATGAKLVALDNVAHLFAGNENDRHDVTRFVNLLNRLARDTGAAIILVGHPNKSGDTYSGSTAWLNAVRSQVWMDTPRDPEGHVLDRDARTLSIGKANYAPKGDAVAFRWHNWAFVREDDLPADTRAEIAEISKANGENAAFMRCLASATESRRAVSHNPGVNYFGTVFPAMPEGKGYTCKQFKTAFERLLHLGEIELDRQLWKGDNRHWKYGIKAAEKCANPPAPTPCADLRQPSPQSGGNPCADLRAPTPPYTTYKGAGPESPPPPDEVDQWDGNVLSFAPNTHAPDDDDLDWGTDEEPEF